MQIRQFDCSFKDAFASVIDIFHDQGFFIQKSDSNIGLIVAKGSTKNISPIHNTNKIIDIQVKVLLIKIHI